MTRPIVRQLPPAPQRGEDFQTFTEKANAHVAALTPWTDDVNELATWVNDTAEDVEQNAQTAVDAAQSASNSAQSASDSAGAAANSAQSARDEAERAESAVAALPEGTISDEMVAPDKTWSSEKITEEIANAGAVGSVLFSIPGKSLSGYLELNGGTVLSSEYPDLDAFVGNYQEMRAVESALQTSPVATSLYGGFEFNGIAVAVGSGGTILTSADGISWTKQTSPVATHLRGGFEFNGIAVAVGSGGTILTLVRDTETIVLRPVRNDYLVGYMRY